MNTKQKLQLHDRLYRHADNLIKKHNPCQIEGKTCLRGKNPCCVKCKYLGENGCTIESLMCKLHLCSAAKEQSPKLSKILGRIQNKAFIHGLLLVRGSRKDLVDRLNYALATAN